MERRIAARGIILNKKGELFAQKFRTHDGGDFWGTPGGGLDSGESLVECIRREMIEETGIEPVIGKLLFIQQFKMTRHDGVVREHMEFFYHIENHADYETVDLSTTTHGAIELTRCAFIDPKQVNILPEFLQSVDIQNHVESSQPVHVANYLRD